MLAQEGTPVKTAKPIWKEWLESLILAGIMAGLIIVFVGQSYIVAGHSMEPTLRDGERLFIDKISYRFTEPRRGDIVVLKTPYKPYIKRIIAVGGDTIAAREGTVIVNGKPLNEPYIKSDTPGSWGPVTVPKGHYFVMGDNRYNSDDSRGTVGFLARERIIGRAVFRYWPITAVGIPTGLDERG